MKEKSIAAALLLFFLFSFFAAIIEGGGGIVATRLTANVTAVQTSIPVQSTAGYAVAGSDQSLRVIYIQDERIEYTAFNAANTTFTGCVRGTGDTDAVTHQTGLKVYSADSNVINTALGFNISESQTEIGSFSAMQMVPKFFFISMPKLITWDFNFLKTGGWQYVRYALFCLSAGFVISMTLMLFQALGGVLQAVWKLKGLG